MSCVVIMQPSYLPWLGYFDLLRKADLFLVYDNVQFDKDGWRNRNKIKTAQGPQWLTVPVLTKGLNGPLNSEVKINPTEHWQKKHLKSIELNYRKAECFEEAFPVIEACLNGSYEKLIDLNLALIRQLSDYLKINVCVKTVSSLGLELPDGKNEKLIEILKAADAKEFYEPQGGKGYIEPHLFEAQGIQLTFQDYRHPTYPQLYGDFVPSLSIVDLILNCGSKSHTYFK